MTNGFAELSENEIEMIDGGVDWNLIGTGVSVIMTTIGTAAALSTPVGWAGLACCGAAFVGGYITGTGIIR